jgi:hypothetical protein
MNMRFTPFASLCLVVAVLFAAGCRGAPARTADHQADLEALYPMMLGTFSSAEQARLDPDNFFNIRLVMVPIWTERGDGYWLYVEQAAAGALDRPYRQRVYHLSVQDDADAPLRSEVYTLPGDPLAFVGAWARPDVFEAIGPGDLELREGCAIHLSRQPDGTFVGATRGTGCASTLGDAAYATSEVVIRHGLLSSWDRGYTASGEQAWGAEAGPYLFRLESAGPPEAP